MALGRVYASICICAHDKFYALTIIMALGSVSSPVWEIFSQDFLNCMQFYPIKFCHICQLFL